MELIKRRILVKRELIPDDSGDTYHFGDISGITGGTKILLTNKAVDLGFFDVEPYLDVSGVENGEITITSNGVGHFYINSNVRWKIRKTVDWIILDTYDGKNNTKITINLGKYNALQSRSGEIIISTDTPNINGITIIIKQNPFEIG